jgi:hypothetical protein
MQMSLWFWIWGAASAVLLILGFVRDKRGRAIAPWPFFWFAAISAAVTLFWPSIMGGWLSAYEPWVFVGWIVAGLIVAFANFGWALFAALAVAVLFFGMVPANAFSTSAPTDTPMASPSASTTPTSSPSPTATPDPAADTTVDESAAAVYPDRYLTLLREHGYTVSEVDGVQIPNFTTCSTEYDKKLWGDAICPPLDPKDRGSVLAHILADPAYAAHVATGLTMVELRQLDGNIFRLTDRNPWLNEFKDPTLINDWGQSAMAATGPMRVDYAKKMVLVALLVERFSDGGVQGDRETAFNFRLIDGDGGSFSVNAENPSGTIPEIGLSPKQYKGEFVVFRVTYKGFEGCFGEFGINTGDGRFAGFTCEQPKPVVPTATPPDNPTPPEHTTPPTTPPSNECVQPASPGEGWTWDQGACKWNPPSTPPMNPVCVQPDKPGEEYTWSQEECEWIPFDKLDRNNPTPPEGVDQQPQPDPVETTPPPAVDPIDPTDPPGSSDPDVPVDGGEDNPTPSDPPAVDPSPEPSPSDPGTHIPDPDATSTPAAATVGVGFLLLGLRKWRRR